MRKITADYIFPLASPPIKNGIVTIDAEGTILDIIASEGLSDSSIEYHPGIICPGFINTHCHLELSHLRSKLAEQTGIPGFISELLRKRSDDHEDTIQSAIADAEAEMIRNGIVAVGDISNNAASFNQKAKGNLYYHTFIEVLAMDPERASEVFENGKQLSSELFYIQLSNSIVPHAPYTASEKLLKLINEHAFPNNDIICIHNQESLAERELLISGSGSLFETFKSFGFTPEKMRITGKGSLPSTLPFLNKASKILLVHNTFTSREDLKWIKEAGIRNQELYWATCPNANLYIENKLPAYDLFISENLKMTIGTDSLASNWSLSVLDELKTITKFYPQISLETLLTWATKNGAEFLGLAQLGTIEKGKKPGLNLLKNLEGRKITERTEVVKLA
jgi:cytosine/adenosine deaminase-related metal-dependent hydrolase